MKDGKREKKKEIEKDQLRGGRDNGWDGGGGEKAIEFVGGGGKKGAEDCLANRQRSRRKKGKASLTDPPCCKGRGRVTCTQRRKTGLSCLVNPEWGGKKR